MPIKTILFVLFILLLVGGGWWLGYGNGCKKNTVSEKPIFTPDEVCEMLDYDLNGKAGFLLQKGYKEKGHSSNEKYNIYEENYALFPIGNIGQVVFPTEYGWNFYEITFNIDQKEAYLRFLSQFPKIISPFPKEPTSTPESSMKIDKCIIFARGFERKANGYVVNIQKNK